MFFFMLNLYHIDVIAEHSGNGGMQMSVRERILAIRIAEAISKHPEIAEELGISAELLPHLAAGTEVRSKTVSMQ